MFFVIVSDRTHLVFFVHNKEFDERKKEEEGEEEKMIKRKSKLIDFLTFMGIFQNVAVAAEIFLFFSLMVAPFVLLSYFA